MSCAIPLGKLRFRSELDSSSHPVRVFDTLACMTDHPDRPPRAISRRAMLPADQINAGPAGPRSVPMTRSGSRCPARCAGDHSRALRPVRSALPDQPEPAVAGSPPHGVPGRAPAGSGPDARRGPTVPVLLGAAPQGPSHLESLRRVLGVAALPEASGVADLGRRPPARQLRHSLLKGGPHMRPHLRCAVVPGRVWQ